MEQDFKIDSSKPKPSPVFILEAYGECTQAAKKDTWKNAFNICIKNKFAALNYTYAEARQWI